MLFTATLTFQRFALLQVHWKSFSESDRDVPEDSLPYEQCFMLKIMTVYGVWAVSLTTALMFPCHSNDSFEGEPEEKRRKTTNVVIEQPATDSKVLIDNVPDNSSLFEEVWDMHTCLFFLLHIELLTFNCQLCLSYIIICKNI